MMKLKLFRIISALLMISLMVIIFSFSAQTAAESSVISGGFSKLILSIFYPPFKELSELGQNEIIGAISTVVRKGAHFSVYGLLGFSAQMTMISYIKIPFWLRNAAAFSICVLYAATDEIHQLFVSGRSGEVRDVLIDSCGALMFIMIGIAVMIINKRIRGLVIKE